MNPDALWAALVHRLQRAFQLALRLSQSEVLLTGVRLLLSSFL